MNLKDSIRKEAKRKAVVRSGDYIKKASFDIFQQLISLNEYRCAKSIFVYYATGSEVDTSEIIKKALADNIRVSIPKIVGDKIVPIVITTKTTFETDKYGIKEPISGVIATDVELCIVPLVAFDRTKARLGHGAGFYDKFLSDFKGIKIALAFSDQEESSVPMTNFDVYMDKVITEKEIIK